MEDIEPVEGEVIARSGSETKLKLNISLDIQAQPQPDKPDISQLSIDNNNTSDTIKNLGQVGGTGLVVTDEDDHDNDHNHHEMIINIHDQIVIKPYTSDKAKVVASANLWPYLASKYTLHGRTTFS